MKKKAKTKKKVTEGTKIKGVVLTGYVQVNVLPKNINHVAEELSQLILTEYYRQYVTPNIAGLLGDTSDDF
jgi:hypothetical protein